jgi:membrane protein DedA with SNARE-associated domain
MAGVPTFISEGPWWGLFLFLTGVVFLRAQATYWAGWWLRKGAASGAEHDSLDEVAHEEEPTPEHRPTRRARIAARFSGPGWDKAQAFLERWGFVGIPVSFLTIGFQTMVNAAAGFTRMRWDLYTVAMIPGCLAWAAIYASLGVGLMEAWKSSPWLFIAILVGLVGLAWILTAIRRRTKARAAA